MDPILEQVSQIRNFLWILNDIEERIETKNGALFLDHLFYALERSEPSELAQIHDLGSLLRRRSENLPKLKRFHEERSQLFPEMKSGSIDDIATRVLDEALPQVTHNIFLSDIFGSAYYESPQEFGDLIQRIVAEIESSTVDELESDFKLDQLMYDAGQMHAKEIVDAVFERVMDLDPLEIFNLDIHHMCEGLLYLQMPARPPHPYESLARDLAMKFFETVNSMPIETLIGHEKFPERFSQFLRLSQLPVVTPLGFTKSEIDQTKARFAEYLDGLSEDQLRELDPEGKIVLVVFPERQERGVSSGWGNRQKPTKAHLAEMMQRAIVRAQGDDPVIVTSFAIEDFMFAGMFRDVERLIDRYLELPDEAFGGFNVSRFFSNLQSRAKSNTLREAKRTRDLPPPIPVEKIDALKEKVIRAFISQDKLSEVENGPSVIHLIKEHDPELFDELVVPRLYNEVFGRPMYRTQPNSPMPDSRSISDQLRPDVGQSRDF